MSQYYYAVASLPLLSLETERPVPLDKFLQLCRDWLSSTDLEILESASISDLNLDNSEESILKKWIFWERSLRNELVRLRSQKLNVEPEKYLRDNPSLLESESIARSAFALESPLSVEDLLNRARWSYLEDLEIGHYFDIEKLVLYYLRLQLLHRILKLNRTKGMARYQEISKQISSDIDEMRKVKVE